MGKGLLALVLAWALIATGFAVYKTVELQDVLNKVQNMEKELATYKKQLANVTELQDRVDFLERSSRMYKELFEDMRAKYSKLKEMLDSKNRTIYVLKKKIEVYEKVPYDYYFVEVFPRYNNTLSEMKEFLKNLTIPENLSDTETEAYLEWALRNAGFDAHIAYGEIEDEETGNETMDTWLVVFLINGTYNIDILNKTVKVFNATEELEIEEKGVEKEYEYEPVTIFKDIYSAIMFFGSVDRWDWWNVTGFPPEKVLS